LQSPETGSQNRRYRDLSRRQRPHLPHFNPRKCPQTASYLSETGKHRFASDYVVDQPGSNWALGNHCFHGVYEAFPLNSEASKRYRWGTVGRLDLIEETEGR
jgi:hypothetical protein